MINYVGLYNYVNQQCTSVIYMYVNNKVSTYLFRPTYIPAYVKHLRSKKLKHRFTITRMSTQAIT